MGPTVRRSRADRELTTRFTEAESSYLCVTWDARLNLPYLSQDSVNA